MKTFTQPSSVYSVDFEWKVHTLTLTLHHPIRPQIRPVVRRGGSLRTVWGHKKKGPSEIKKGRLTVLMVVPTGLFQVKTGIYMPYNFKGLGRRPFSWLT